MLQNSAPELNAAAEAWDDFGRAELRPEAAALFILAGLLLVLAALGGVLMAAAGLGMVSSPVIAALGLFCFLAGAGFGGLLLYKLFSGAFLLRLAPRGFTLGRRAYAWADVGEFVPGIGLQCQNVYFSHRGRRRSLPNAYGMTADALAALLNRQRHCPASFPAPARRAAEGRNAARRTLPLEAWAVIFVVFFMAFSLSGPLAMLGWSIAAPVSYQAHRLDDYDLANRAGHDPRFLPALLARARGGDNVAMYQLGDLYDPTDFLCETAVPKSAANAMYWYDKALPMDDQGSERALGVFYHLGIGAPRDDARAAALLERAAAHNDSIAEYYLGTMLAKGEGEKRDMSRAIRLEKAAAAQGDADAQRWLRQNQTY